MTRRKGASVAVDTMVEQATPVARVLDAVADGLGRATAALAAHPLPGVVAGAGCIAASGILVQLADVPPATAAVARCAYALPVLVLLALVERRQHGPAPRRVRYLGALAGVCFALDLVIWHHAIDLVGAGLGTVLGNLQVVVVGLAAWALFGERPSRALLGAVPIVLLGVLLIAGITGGGEVGRDPALGAVLGALTSVAYAGFILLLRAGGADARRPAGPLADATGVAIVVGLVLGAALGELDLAPTWPAHGWLVLLALTSQILGWLLLSVVLPRLPATLGALLLLLQPVGALALAAVALGERPSGAQLAGVAVVLGGVLVAARRPAIAVDTREVT